MTRINVSARTSYLVVVLISGLVSVLVALGAWARVSPWALGLGLTAWLVALSVYLLRRPPPGEAAPRWRDEMPCYLSIQDPELRILETNQLFRQDFGNGVGEFCYRAYKDRDSPCPNCPVLRTFEDGKHHSGEESVVTREGQVAHVVVTSAPLRDRHGRLTGVVEMSTNITELKNLRSELDHERQAFQNLFDIVPCYISIQDRGYHIEQTNRLFREHFGDGIGSLCYEVIKGRDAICPDCPVERTFADGKVHSSEESATAGGETSHMIVQSMPVHDDQGEVRAVMRVSTDITEVKKLKHRLSLMGLAVAGMAHRIKNILMGLEGGIFVVNTGFEMEEPETVNEGWGMVERNVAKISRTVKDLLYCSKRHEAGFQDDVSPSEIIREVYELFRPRADKEGFELALELPDTSYRGTFDPDGLQKLATNLTSNALDACLFDPTAGEKQHIISMRCSHNSHDDTEIEVSDNGAGIPDDVHHKVFENFFSTKGTEGTGLGLLVVQKVAEEHGGTVSFDSREGQGTTFRVVLPARK